MFLPAFGQPAPTILRAEFIKQAKGRLVVVLNKADADAVLTGASEEPASGVRSQADTLPRLWVSQRVNTRLPRRGGANLDWDTPGTLVGNVQSANIRCFSR